MKLDSIEHDGKIRFSISEIDMKYEEILKMCFYNLENEVYYKDFPIDYPYMKQVRKNFAESGEVMFNQLGYFTEIPWEKALMAFCKIIEGHNIDWWLTGSCAACLRGIDFKPHDVDIMINSGDVEKISEIFSTYLIEPIIDTNGWLTKDFGVIFLYARIDIASDPVKSLDDPVPIDCGPIAKDNLEIINWNGYKIRIPLVEYQLNSNRMRGRKERVKLIEKYLKYNK